MSDISKQIVALLVTKDLYKAKLLISESLNQKIGLLLEEKLISYAPTIHSSNLFEDDNKAMPPTNSQVFTDQEQTELKWPKKSYISNPTTLDMVRQIADGIAIKVGTQALKLGTWGKAIGIPLIAAGTIDAGWQTKNTVEELNANTDALAKADQLKASIAARENNNSSQSNVVGVTPKELLSTAKDPNYVLPWWTSVQAAGTKVAVQGLNTLIGALGTNVARDTAAGAIEKQMVAKAEEAVAANMATQSRRPRIVGGSGQSPIIQNNLGAKDLETFERPGYYQDVMYDIATKWNDAAPGLKRFLSMSKERVISKVAAKGAENVTLSPVPGSMPALGAPAQEIETARKELAVANTNYGANSEELLAAAAKAKAKTSGSDLLAALLPMPIKPLAGVATALGASETGIGAGAVVTQSLWPKWQADVIDRMHPPATPTGATNLVKEKKITFNFNNSSNPNTVQQNFPYVFNSTEDPVTGRGVVVNAVNQRVYSDDLAPKK